jgi:hypothetical protein
MKIFGLKLAKWAQWEEVLAIESSVAPTKWQMFRLALKMPFVRRRLARERYRTCWKCPVFDRSLRRCRPYSGAPQGCGCWMPLKVRAFFDRRGCWARQNAPAANIGWKK